MNILQKVKDAPAKIAERNAGIANGTLVNVLVPGKDLGGGFKSADYYEAVPAKNVVPIPSGSGYQTIIPPSSPKPKASNAKTIGIAAGGVIVVILAIIFFLKA